MFRIACLFVHRPGISLHWCDYFWLWSSVFPLDGKSHHSVRAYTHTYTHTAPRSYHRTSVPRSRGSILSWFVVVFSPQAGSCDLEPSADKRLIKSFVSVSSCPYPLVLHMFTDLALVPRSEHLSVSCVFFSISYILTRVSLFLLSPSHYRKVCGP